MFRISFPKQSLRCFFLLVLLAFGFKAFPVQAEAPAQTLQALVNTANQLANQDRYGEAIPLYEQALKLSPGEVQLRKNLGVLYFNHATALQKQKRYDEANALLDKAMGLDPADIHARKAKAGSAFQQAMDLRDSGSKDYATMQTLLKQAMAQAPEEAAFRKAMGAVLFDEAMTLASADEPEPAAQKLEAVLIYDNDPVVRQSLANLYLTLAARSQDKAQRKQWADKAVTAHPGEATEAQARQVMKNPELGQAMSVAGPGGSAVAHPFLSVNPSAGGVSPPAPVESASLLNTISAIEQSLDVLPPIDASMNARLEAAETKVLGAPQPGAMTQRMDQLAHILGVSSQTAMAASATPMLASAAPVTGRVLAQPAGGDPDYLKAVFTMTDGKVIRWRGFPVRVYIEGPLSAEDLEAAEDPRGDGFASTETGETGATGVSPEPATPQNKSKKKKADPSPVSTGPLWKEHPLYRAEYRQAVLAGLEAWKTATGGFTDYVIVKNPLAADVQIFWAEEAPDRFSADGGLAAHTAKFYEGYTPPKQSPLARVLTIASMFTPGYFGLAPQAAAAALQYQQMKKLQALVDESKITLALAPTQGLSPEIARRQLRNQTVYQFGQALGLKTKSPHAEDALSGDLPADRDLVPTARDLATLRELYSRPADLVLNVR